MFLFKTVLLVLAAWRCYATLDLQGYESRVRAQLGGTGSSSWQQYETAIRILQAEANSSQTTELLQAQAQSTGSEINCPMQNSHTVPTSVHRLRPEDVKVVAAIGDSLTAASGAKARTIIGLLTNYRGVSWSIGGQESLETYTTLPNILKKFNPHIVGFATGSGGPDSDHAKLDKAVAGAVSGDMVEQARKLVDIMKACEHIDFEHDWKVVTLLIGGNDLCAYCEDTEKWSPIKYVENIRAALDILHQELPRMFVNVVTVMTMCLFVCVLLPRTFVNVVTLMTMCLFVCVQLPRTFVNVVTVMDVVEISKLQRTFTCDVLHFFLCRCVSYASEEALAELQAANMRYMSVTNRLVASGRYDDRDDFTVVVQPFLQETKLPRTETGEYDRSYFAPDCFHFSLKAHAAAASALWNNMLEPVGSKRTDWHVGEPLECPTEDRPYFATAKNSHSSLSSAGPGVGVKTFDSFQKTSQDTDKPAGSSESVAGPAAMIVVGCVLLVSAAVGAAVFILRRRRKVKGREAQPLLQESTDMATVLTRSVSV
ncbi:hydrolase [Branchiostoma belcheri]|nr:hydrolase [Branchiostoma belcheri]